MIPSASSGTQLLIAFNRKSSLMSADWIIFWDLQE